MSWHIFSIYCKFNSLISATLSGCSFVARIFGHALEDSHLKSSLVHSLSVCISLLDPKRSIPSTMMYSFRNQQVYESPMHANPDTIDAMLPKLSKFSDCGSLYGFELLNTCLPVSYHLEVIFKFSTRDQLVDKCKKCNAFTK